MQGIPGLGGPVRRVRYGRAEIPGGHWHFPRAIGRPLFYGGRAAAAKGLTRRPPARISGAMPPKRPRSAPRLHALDRGRIARLRRRALQWYERERRDLPWRRDRDPYRVWISEILLQQTRVEAAIPYFERFLERFPGVTDLAAADVPEVLRLWSGLGYYRRARHLHAAAQSVVRDHGGALPRSAEALRALPGIGEYTVGAIRSIAFGERAAAVDGNAIRVIARLQAYQGDPTKGAGARAIRDWAEALVPARDPGAWSQALMEIGARICIPGRPRCGDCPFRRSCLGRRAGVAESIPPTRRVVARRTRDVAAVIRRGGALLLAQRPVGGLMGGLWELPGGEAASGEAPVAALRRHLRESIAAAARVGERVGEIRHSILDRQIEGSAYECRLGRRPPVAKGYDALRWARAEEIERLPLTGATRKYLRVLPGPSASPRRAATPRARPPSPA